MKASLGNKHMWARICMSLAVVLGSMLHLYFARETRSAIAPPFAMALASLQELHQWGTFLIGVQTSAIAAMGFFFLHMTQSEKQPSRLTDGQLTAATIAVVFFGSSIVVTTYLLGYLPWLILHLEEQGAGRNYFYSSSIGLGDWPQVGPMTGLQYILFIFGSCALSSFVFLRLLGSMEPGTVT